MVVTVQAKMEGGVKVDWVQLVIGCQARLGVVTVAVAEQEAAAWIAVRWVVLAWARPTVVEGRVVMETVAILLRW